MSKVFNMVGGGGKNISSIIITGLKSTDIITCTKAGKSYTATWDATAQHWEIVGLPLGTFSLTATNGAKSTTATVQIDVTGVYEVEMSFRSWLYKDGDECDGVTGSWNKFRINEPVWNDGYNYLIITKNASSITITQQHPGHYAAAALGTSNKIDLTNYSKIKFEIDINANHKYWFFRCVANANDYNKGGSAEMLIVENGSTHLKDGIGELNISNVSGYCYVIFWSGSDSSLPVDCKATLKKVWLE